MLHLELLWTCVAYSDLWFAKLTCVVTFFAAKSCFRMKERYVINLHSNDLIHLWDINQYDISVFRMITDVQLAIFANLLGVSVFLLVVLYHYIAANNPKSHAS